MNDQDPLHSVGVVVDEGNAFMKRNEETLGWNTTASVTGGLVWGLMRAIAECPNCPGAFRTPIGKENGYESAFDVMVCPRCNGVWTHTGGK